MTLHPGIRLIVAGVTAVLLPASACAEAVRAERLDPVRDAIARAVVERLGAHARATVTGVQTAVRAETPLTASPEPGARTGAAARFVLFADGVRVGTAVATTRVAAVHVRAVRAIGRNDVLAARDLAEMDDVVHGQLLRRLPRLEDLVGARARRNLAAGELLSAAEADVPPLVKSGDEVTVVVRVGAVHAEGRGTASGSGHRGDVIRVVNAGVRKPVSARITGPATVEILP